VVLIAAVLTLAEVGPGSPSVDAALGSERQGAKWALLSLLGGVIGAVGAHVIAESTPATAEPAAPAASPDAATDADAAAQPDAAPST